MLFSSPIFIFAFLPLVYLINLKCPLKISNLFLAAASLFFYAWGEPAFVLLFLASITMSYFLSIFMMKSHKKLLFTLCIIMNLGLMIVFKYSGFIMQTIYSLFNLNFSVPNIKLPLGISFFTFQTMSYVIDLYNGKVELQKSYLKLFLYISFFPQLVAGPIVKYKDIDQRLSHRKITLSSTAAGIKRFIWGLSKKVLIANVFAAAADKIFALPTGDVNITLAWIGAISYIIQIYFDS